MIRRDQRAPRSGKFDVPHLHPGPLVVNVVKMQKWKNTGIRSAPLQVREEIDAVQLLARASSSPGRASTR